MPMNPEIKARWTAALRSGEYEQDAGHLRTEDGFCCLGVLCDLAVKDNVTVQSAPGDENYLGDGFWQYGLTYESMTLPPDVMNWAGLDQSSPDVKEPFPAGARMDARPQESLPSLAILNDSGTPFAIIADIIDQQL